MKTKEDIERKRAKKKSELEYSEKIKLKKKRFELSKKYDDELEREYAKAERKSKARLNKKIVEYDRKCKNEIRKLEGKEERVYKKKVKLNVVEFALELAQENSRLRDSDSEGRGFCISCDLLKERGQHAGGHYLVRGIKNICLAVANINLQCHSCNQLMGPFKNTPKGIQTAQQYRSNLIKKVGQSTVERLEQRKLAYFQKGYETNGDYGQGKIHLHDYIEELIKENEERWKGKNFYSPRKNWRKIWENYKSSFIINKK